MLEWNKARSLKTLGHGADRGTFRGLWLYVEERTFVFSRWWRTIQPDTDIIWDRRGSGDEATGRSSKYAGKEKQQKWLHRLWADESVWLPLCIPLPGPCYLIKSPSPNSKHRCFSHPQPALFIQSADGKFSCRSTVTSFCRMERHPSTLAYKLFWKRNYSA